MLDYYSQGTFINADLTKKLKGDGMKTTTKIKSLNGGDKNLKESVWLKISKSIGLNSIKDLTESD